MANTERNYQTQPHWVRKRRFSIHGIDHMQTGAFDKDPVPSFDDLYHQYCEALVGVDENLGRILQWLDQHNLSKSTLVIYMGDNGFELGEHGFYDKCDGLEHSMRVPLLAYAPGWIRPGTTVDQMVQNIDIAPTVLQACGIPTSDSEPKMDGRSFLPLLKGDSIDWRDHILRDVRKDLSAPKMPFVIGVMGVGGPVARPKSVF